jgi:hypothetical protein
MDWRLPVSVASEGSRTVLNTDASFFKRRFDEPFQFANSLVKDRDALAESSQCFRIIGGAPGVSKQDLP